MDVFSFETAPRIICGAGSRKMIASLAAEFGARNVLLVTDKPILQAGLLGDILACLKDTSITVNIFDGVEADPPERIVLQALDAAQEAQADLVIGVGGGSSMDTAKLVALLSKSVQTLEDVYGIGMAKGERLPLIQVPTTAGTGSEVTPISIVTTPTLEKKGVVSPLLYPDAAVLDPELTLKLPMAVTAMTGIDAMVHAIEAYTSKQKKNLLSDALACKALTLLSKNLPVVLADGANIKARQEMLLGATMAGMAFANAPVAAVHALAYPLGSLFHIPHGHSNALVLAPVLKFNLRAAEKEYAELAKVVMPARQHGSAAEAAGNFIQYISDLVASMPFAKRLTELEINAADVPGLSAGAMKIERLLVNNPRTVTYDDAVRIYESIL